MAETLWDSVLNGSISIGTTALTLLITYILAKKTIANTLESLQIQRDSAFELQKDQQAKDYDLHKLQQINQFEVQREQQRHDRVIEERQVKERELEKLIGMYSDLQVILNELFMVALKFQQLEKMQAERTKELKSVPANPPKWVTDCIEEGSKLFHSTFQEQADKLEEQTLKATSKCYQIRFVEVDDKRLAVLKRVEGIMSSISDDNETPFDYYKSMSRLEILYGELHKLVQAEKADLKQS